jgi:predicted DsbA family dithiol-disulfide isomerase
MLHIDIWADFARPARYLAKPRIDQAIAASGHADAITVTYRPGTCTIPQTPIPSPGAVLPGTEETPSA